VNVLLLEDGPEAVDRHRRRPVALDTVAAEPDLEDAGAGRHARGGEDEVPERPRDERVPAGPDDGAEDVRVRAEHEGRARAQAGDRELLLARVGLGVQLDAPVEEAHGDVGPPQDGANVGGDLRRIGTGGAGLPAVAVKPGGLTSE